MKRQMSLPHLWLVSDARNNARLESALLRLPRGSGLIYRHDAQRERYAALARIACRRGHCVVLKGTAAEARSWRAAGAYGDAKRLARGPATMRLVTVHSLRELAKAHRARADAVLISPVFVTRSHPGGKVLGPLRFRLIAARAKVPVIALGGMNARRARAIGAESWAAIDGL